MKVCIVAFATILAANASRQEVTPVQKVIEMLSGMLEKGKKEKHEEQVLFAQRDQYCGDNKQARGLVIDEELMDMDNLKALIAKDSADESHLLKLISYLDEDQDIWSADMKAAGKNRKMEAADYAETHQDYTESITALKAGIAVLKKQMHDRRQRSSLAQVSNLANLNLIPETAKKTINAFLEQGENSLDESEGAPAANAYEAQSNSIVDMLQQLHDKFIDERTTLEKSEVNARHAYQMMMQELKAQIVEAVNQKHFNEQSRAKVLGSKADETADLNSLTKTELSDEEFVKDLTATCNMEEADYEARQQLRSDEIGQIEKALELLSGSAVSGNAEKHLPSLVQKQLKKGASFSQLRSNSNSQIQNKVSQFLRLRAKTLNSRLLANVAERVSEDPFGKIKQLLKDLMTRLMEEAGEESEHKGYCDTELATNGQTRKEKTARVETLHAEIDELSSEISKIDSKIGDLSGVVAEIDAAMSKATQLREEEKGKNAETMSDSQDAQTAISQAMTVLKEFYAKAAEATSFAQIEPYKGMQSESGGVVGMLEVIQSDFARLTAETKSAEAEAQKEFDTFSADSKADKASKTTEIEHKRTKKQNKSHKLTERKKDLEGTQKELDSALNYFDKLKPQCLDSEVTYEDRVARRQEEIQSLQEALKVLDGEDLA